MGKCCSRTPDESYIFSESPNSEQSTIRSVKNKTQLQQKKGLIHQQKYYSSLLNPNIGKIIITEEDSSNISQSQLQDEGCQSRMKAGTLKSLSLHQSYLGELNKQFNSEQEIDQHSLVRFINVATNRFLHSHAVKYDTKRYEVSCCYDGNEVYDFWRLMPEHNRSIFHNDIIIINHKLLNFNMRSSSNFISSKSKQQQVFTYDSLKDLEDEDYWKIEISNLHCEVLCNNTLVKIKHVKSDGYLQSSRARGLVNNHLEIIVGPKNDSQELWLLQLIQ